MTDRGSSHSRSVACLVAGVVLLSLAQVEDAVADCPDGPGRFVYHPRRVSPGESITVSGECFPPGSASAAVLLTDAGENMTVLGSVPLVDGGFEATVTVPATVVPGYYLVRMVDSLSQWTINLLGTLTVTPSSAPWFNVSPTTAAPGEALSVVVEGFSSLSPWAAVGIVVGDKIRLLGIAELHDGGFNESFTLPLLPARRAYPVFVMDATRAVAWNTSGQVTAAYGPVEPTIEVGTYPIGSAVNPITNRIYVPNGGDNTLSVIDGVTHSVIAAVAMGNLPCAVGLNPFTNRIYVANVNTNDLSVVDGETHTVLDTVPVGTGPCAVGVLPGLNRVFVGNYVSNDLTVVDGEIHSVIETVPLGGPGYGVKTNVVTNRVYVGTGIINSVTVVDGATNEVLALVPVGKAPDAIGVNPRTNRIYAANYFSDTVSVIDGVTHEVLAAVPVGKEPSGVAVNPSTNRVFIGNYAGNTVSVLDGVTNRIAATFAVGTTPDGISVNPVTNRVYAVNSNTNDVTVLRDIPR